MIICNKVTALVPDEIQAEVEENVVYGSSNFLQAFSQTSMMWYHVELSEVNPQSLDNSTVAAQSTIGLLNSALDRYRKVLGFVNEHGVKPEALEALKNFDYSEIAETLNVEGDKWDSFITTAKSGNVYGLLQDFVEGISKLISLLESNLAFLEKGEVPPVINFGQLNSEWQAIIQHGYQSAQVFHKLDLSIGNIP